MNVCACDLDRGIGASPEPLSRDIRRTWDRLLDSRLACINNDPTKYRESYISPNGSHLEEDDKMPRDFPFLHSYLLAMP